MGEDVAEISERYFLHFPIKTKYFDGRKNDLDKYPLGYNGVYKTKGACLYGTSLLS